MFTRLVSMYIIAMHVYVPLSITNGNNKQDRHIIILVEDRYINIAGAIKGNFHVKPVWVIIKSTDLNA